MKTYSWGQRPVVSESHANDLETEAALLEFRDGLPRARAEEQAYQAYLRDHHSRAAAHHLQGLRSAQANGDQEEARKHGVMYGQHLEALGEDPLEAVPASVRAHLESEDRSPVYRFRAHPTDRLVLAAQKPAEALKEEPAGVDKP